MKFTYVILAAIIIGECPMVMYPQAKTATNRTIVKIDDIKSVVTQEATSILHERGIEVKNLPQKIALALQGKINYISNQLTNHLRLQKKNEISLTIIRKDLEAVLVDFTENALTVVSKKVLPQAVTAFIEKLVQEKPVNVTKLPENMKDEFNRRKASILQTLINNMKAGTRDYVYVSELESLCHKKLDLFLERAKYVLISQWGQGAMTALDSLKFVTNTQQFPIQPPKANS